VERYCAEIPSQRAMNLSTSNEISSKWSEFNFISMDMSLSVELEEGIGGIGALPFLSLELKFLRLKLREVLIAVRELPERAEELLAPFEKRSMPRPSCRSRSASLISENGEANSGDGIGSLLAPARGAAPLVLSDTDTECVRLATEACDEL
jgi:hypothetical protein